MLASDQSGEAAWDHRCDPHSDSQAGSKAARPCKRRVGAWTGPPLAASFRRRTQRCGRTGSGSGRLRAAVAAIGRRVPAARALRPAGPGRCATARDRPLNSALRLPATVGRHDATACTLRAPARSDRLWAPGRTLPWAIRERRLCPVRVHRRPRSSPRRRPSGTCLLQWGCPRWSRSTSRQAKR